MKGIINIIEEFFKRNGSYVLFATIVARLLSFLASWIALQFIDDVKLGMVIFAFNIIILILPIADVGLHQSLLRFGAQLNTNEEKSNLFLYVLKKGSLISILISILIVIISSFINFKLPNTQFYLLLLSLSTFTYFLLELIKIQFRILNLNKHYAYVEITFNALLVVSVLLMSYFFKEIGYSLALVFVPLVVFMLFYKKLNITKNNNKSVIKDISEFWKYGFFAGLSNVSTQLLIAIDILLIGFLLVDAEMVTHYKYISLIPFSLLFLPRAFITTDFVTLSKNIFNKQFIKNYIKNYLSLFGLLSLLVVVIIFLTADYLLLIFGENYLDYKNVFYILIFGVIGVFTLRGLFGNLLSALGKAHVNYWIATIALILNICLNLYLIPTYQLLGAAITSAIIMWITGVLSWILFRYYYTKTKV